jgi:hypothetical protein
MKNVILLVSVLISTLSFGQSISFEVVSDIEVRDMQGNKLELSGVGGINQPQLYNLDINNDGILDIFMFDRSGAKVTSLIHDGKGNYTYHPEFDNIYPKRFSTWVVFKDYNADNLPDLWFYNPIDDETSLYRNITKAGDKHAMFEVADLELKFYNFGQPPLDSNDVYCDLVNIPAIEDVDGDGDIDFMSLQNIGFGITLFLNNTVESGKPLDPPSFELADECWGDFVEYDGLNKIDFRRDQWCLHKVYRHKKKHAGGSSLLILDMDEDSDMDLVMGNAGLPNLNLLYNGRIDHGTKLDTMIASDSLFPSNTVQAAVNAFPASYYLDVDGDGIKDLVVAVNMVDKASYRFRQTNNILYYKNKGKNNHPEFEFQDSTFLAKELNDHGGYTAPVLHDFDKDGDLDIVVATNGDYGITGDSAFYLNLYENVGSKTDPIFQLKKEDYLGLRKDSIRNIAPTYGDIDRDNEDELIIGRLDGTLSVYEITGSGTTAQAALKMHNAYGVNVYESSTPDVVDVDGDGYLDLLVGSYNGNTAYYRNTSKTQTPVFEKEKDTFGYAVPGYWRIEPQYNPDTGEFYDSLVFRPYSNSAPVLMVIDKNGDPELVLGDENGNITIYRDVRSAKTDSFELVEANPFYLSSKDMCFSYNFGAMSKPTLGDIDGDGKLDMVVGVNRGGFQFALSSGSCNLGIEPQRNTVKTLRMYPNPSTGEVRFKGVDAFEAQLIVVNINGERVLSKSINPALGVNLSNLTDGIYAVQLITESERYVGKLVKMN